MTLMYPWFLLCLIILPLLFYFVLKRKKYPTLIVSSVEPFKKALDGRGNIKLELPLLFYFLGAIILCFALSRPRRGVELLNLRNRGIDIVLALDLSGSMTAIDVPKNITTATALQDALKAGKVKDRLEVAKQEIKRFVKGRTDDRIGLIAFASLPYSVCPPTLDHVWLTENLKRLEAEMLGEATGIAAPIASAVSKLKSSDAKRRVLVLFTDGSNNVEAQITPLQAAKLAKDFNVVIYTVGIGSDNAFVFQQSFMGNGFVPISGYFDAELLQKLAELSGGKYYEAADSKGLRQAMQEIDKLEKIDFQQPKFVDYKEYAPLLAGIALLLLLIGFLLEHTIFLRLP